MNTAASIIAQLETEYHIRQKEKTLLQNQRSAAASSVFFATMEGFCQIMERMVRTRVSMVSAETRTAFVPSMTA